MSTEHVIDAVEFEAAENDVKKARGNSWKVYTHKFSEPFSYEGKTYESLTFNWGKLTVKDSLAIETELMMRGKTVVAPEFSGEYKMRMAVRACEEPIAVNVFESFPMADGNKILAKARSFLLKTGS